MPILARFHGLIVKMYFADEEHNNPPHIHIVYGEYKGVLKVWTGRMTEGDLPKKESNKAKELYWRWIL